MGSPKRFVSFSLRAAAVGVLAFVLFGGAAFAATRNVEVGQGGLNFVDEVSHASTSNINVGDTVTWTWNSGFHSTTSGTCSGGCSRDGIWDSGEHGTPFSFSQTFNSAGTFPYYCTLHGVSMTGTVIVTQAGTPACAQNDQTLCLNGGRFEVTADWTKPDSSSGHGTGVKLTDDSGYFWFFTDTNIELVTKVLNGCGLTNSYWVFSAGLTNVGVSLAVRDTQTGAEYAYVNPLTDPGTVYVTQTATSAFPTSCP